jgi:hypothetical protein
MLAVNSKPTDLKKPQLGSLKLEGVRGVFTPDNGLVGRSLKPFNNSVLYQRDDIQAIERYCADNDVYLEGEFYVHGWTFNRIDSCIRGEGNIDAALLQFHVFDCFVPLKPKAVFQTRVTYYKHIVTTLQMQGVNCVHACEQTLMASAQVITDAYVWAIENGYEGFCLKAADLPYKHGRSTLIQEFFTRIKPEDPYDCVVLEIIERQTNLCESEVNELGYLKKRQDKDMKARTGIAQSALVYTPQFGKVHRVSLTRGLTDVDRMRLFEDAEHYIGSCMQFVGIPVPGQVIPRSPRFDKWRLDITPQYLSHDPSDSLFVSWDVAEVESALNSGCDIITFSQFTSLLEQGYQVTSDQLVD